ncbi:MAG: helix-turn-helix domain-containing protein [Chloroflexales bacterium]|nr:helix-turn-helix domain-containing protein [Chloroflexales bacterium]
MQRFGEKLRWLRQQQHMTQRELADQLGFAAQSYINALASGKKRPSAELVFKIARLFGVSTDQLLDDMLEVGDIPPET